MPLYLCSSPDGAIAEDIKPAIAKELTDIHCEVTDAPPTFVHVFFMSKLEEGGVPIQLFGSIRAGRTEDKKEELRTRMVSAVIRIAHLEAKDVSMETVDIPASWVMEGGDILPEPGEEEAWMAAHIAKTKAAASA